MGKRSHISKELYFRNQKGGGSQVKTRHQGIVSVSQIERRKSRVVRSLKEMRVPFKRSAI